MEKENDRAALERGLKSPICISKEVTDVNYDAAVLYMVEHLRSSWPVFAGTHNEDSSYKLMQLLRRKRDCKK
jgi:proline dehydrogenase